MSSGRITKLNVNIDRGRTYITYANKSSRIVVNNPSGHVFRNTSVAGICSNGSDAASQATKFLQRHFGQNGSLRQTHSMCEFLNRLPLGKYEGNANGDKKQEHPKLIYTLDLVKLQLPEPKLATVCERSTAQLGLLELPWHLHTCKWQHLNNRVLDKAKCYCLEIKEAMENVDKLIKSAEPIEAEPIQEKVQTKSKLKSKTKLRRKSQLKSPPKENPNFNNDINYDIQSLNTSVKKLTLLLEKQNQSQSVK